jgi:hypothetical protein
MAQCLAECIMSIVVDICCEACCALCCAGLCTSGAVVICHTCRQQIKPVGASIGGDNTFGPNVVCTNGHYNWLPSNWDDIRIQSQQSRKSVSVVGLTQAAAQQIMLINAPPRPALNNTDPLPHGWEERRAPDGRVFYADNIHQTTTWVRPVSPPIVPPSSYPTAPAANPIGPGHSPTHGGANYL